MSADLQSTIVLEELNAFASRSGHEMTGTLNQAVTLLSLFLKRHPHPEEGDQALLGHLENAARRMQEQIQGLQVYLGIAASVPHFQMMNAGVPLAACQKAAQVVSGPMPEVFADAQQLQILFGALIENAVKFGQPLESPAIEVRAEREGEFWTFTITDNGIGMEQELACEALLPFRRFNGREFSGLGLGLATARFIVRLHGGSIAIQSRAGAGTSVSFTLRAFAP